VPWNPKTREERQRDAQVYRDPEYLRNRRAVLREAAGRCEQCGRSDRRLQVDHATPVTQGGGHDPGNLRALCSGPGSCHAAKTAGEGGGYRAPASDPDHSARTDWSK
jgi:5-methylcytosine-specific restriction endonuclease McrA